MRNIILKTGFFVSFTIYFLCAMCYEENVRVIAMILNFLSGGYLWLFIVANEGKWIFRKHYK